MMNRQRYSIGAALWLVATAIPAAPQLAAAEKEAERGEPGAIAFFESRIRPVLVDRCYECHSAQSGVAEGGLRLDSRDAIRGGGEAFGPAVVPGDVANSSLMTAIGQSDDLRMPPKGPRLSAEVVADFKRWIELGAADPRSESPAIPGPDEIAATAAEHWAYRPPELVSAESIKSWEPDDPPPGSHWPLGEIDRFIEAALKSQQLEPAPEAAPSTLLRRLYFDLIGLPPRPVDQQRFADQIETSGFEVAWQAEIDQLLTMPQFGERWGRHWLDVARFGESSGKESNVSFPYAWRYRDYVIDAFNDDLPYDRFLTEQIAGDLLPAAAPQERARLLIATGFLALGTKNLDEANGWQFLADLIDEQIDTVTQAVTASSVACARCHDHKFDPFSMADYYALAGIFASTETFFGTSVSPSNRIGGKPLPLPPDAGEPIFHASIPSQRVVELQEELESLQRRQQEGRAAVRRAVAAGEDPSGLFTLSEAIGIFWKTGSITGQLAKVDDSGAALPLAMGVLERDQVIDAPLLKRGDIGSPGDPVPRGFPAALSAGPEITIPADQSGRLELAQWLTRPQHPLTGRVWVNRVWQHLFGAGLVATPDNFGTTGERPSHPRLLDQLAVRFVADGWSTKRLIRALVSSRTYRQSSRFDRQAFLQDPDNRLLWRATKRRLDAEAIRDAMLRVSGELDFDRPPASLVGRVIGDRPISLIGLDRRLPADLDGATHRSVYLPIIRDRLPDVLDLFDFAEPSLVTGRRETTNVPFQALYLMNSPFVQDRAAAFAKRLLESSADDQQRIRDGYRRCFNREPDAHELQRSLDFLRGDAAESATTSATATTTAAADDDPNGNTEVDRWTRFAQALLLTAEFRNLD